jgi:hypothetical protein
MPDVFSMGRAALVVVMIALSAGARGAAAQQLVDRVIARVDGTVITQTDLQAAVGFGFVDRSSADPVDALIDRRLMTIDMNRRPPAPPDEAALDEEVARMRAVAGARLSELMAATGVDATRLRAIARDTLMLRSYVETRFPLVAASDADAEQFYRANPELFTRDGALRPFGEVTAQARRGAAEARRTARIDGWLANLRNRMDVEIVPRQPS